MYMPLQHISVFHFSL